MENCRNIFNLSARYGWNVSMENMNGMETAAEIRKTDTDVVIVILSGYARYTILR